MKRLLLYANDKEHSQQVKADLQKRLQHSSLTIVDENPDYIVTIGGDGTLISAFHHYAKWVDHVQFIGIHTGHLGFYTDWQVHELDALIDSLTCKKEGYVSYPLLEIQLEYEDGTLKRQLALNECSIRTLAGTMVCDVYIKHYFFETFRGDGLCIATPTGSTGLNKSLGGGVMHPRLDALQMTEMASLNNLVYRTLSSPVIIPKDEYFVLKLQSQPQDSVMMCDHVTHSLKGVRQIRLQVAPQRIRFAKFKHTHFWDRVEQSFIGKNLPK